MSNVVQIEQRLVDTLTVVHLIKEINPDLDSERIKEYIDSIPTAYDVDKVVEELEHLVIYEILGGLVAGEWIKKEQVLKIVKEGGKNE